MQHGTRTLCIESFIRYQTKGKAKFIEGVGGTVKEKVKRDLWVNIFKVSGNIADS